MTKRILNHLKAYIIHISLLLILLSQITFCFYLRSVRPTLLIIPPAPNMHIVNVLSMGEHNLYFRILAFYLQNTGDNFGRITPLKDYNYQYLYDWITLLDKLDHKSHLIPSIAAYYYSNTQHTPDIKYIIKYLEQHYDNDPENKWWWMYQAVSLAAFKLEDKNWALKLSYKLANTPQKNAPIWVRQMPAFMHKGLQEHEQAAIIMSNIIRNADNIPDKELDFMSKFIEKESQKILNKN